MMKTCLQICITILFASICIFTKGQNDIFRTKVIVPDIGVVGGGFVIFPQKKDTVAMSDDGIVKVNLSVKENRLFYILWSGWKTKIFRFENGQCDTSLFTAIVPDTSYYQSFYQTGRCPICLRSKEVQPIIYGMPTPKMMKKASKGKMYLAGCVMYDYGPHFYCKRDEFEF